MTDRPILFSSGSVRTPDQIRALRPERLMRFAAQVVDSDGPTSVYAACEWSELSDDGKLWIAAIILETFARVTEQANATPTVEQGGGAVK